MILKRFIKSGKSVVILVLICIIVFMGLLVDSQVRTQMQVIGDNNKLKADYLVVQNWKNCVSEIKVYENDGTEYVKVSDVRSCQK